MTADDLVIEKSLVPGFILLRHRRQIALEDPVNTGHLTLKRTHVWIGLRQWKRASSKLRATYTLPFGVAFEGSLEGFGKLLVEMFFRP